MALQESTKLFQRLKDALGKGDLSTADSVLSQLKLQLIQLPALPPSFEQTPTAQQELLLGREVLEQAVLLSLKKQDEAAMERSFAQLRTYYNDTRALLPASPSEVTMQGLNLLRLLVQNRIAEFHTELELIPPQAQQEPAILQPVQLEQWLMEGAYNKVLAASNQSASEVHGMLLAQLATTVRDEAASCSEKAYERLRVADAKKLLLFDNEAAVRAYAKEHGWTVTVDDYIVFRSAATEGTAAAKAIPSLELINNALVYAKELERIV
ncbi:hypothetical protein PLESTB_000518300 [Pleodorina starrii]|uniref:PCI domain-containing protein n=1 Tax=Pleodorina starrii TaxID=330485 RepID=A0A9W6EZZ8_9CHLO|nr:hypothetical protein PLESTM_000381700 [Pleodorina starrii]GLC51583.1 hypothetical protein PLESTB_000518300 [Pleodorina starrii]GLC72352.1 hypothetical protein PLESTF_001238600 [Pleodorina starrii]